MLAHKGAETCRRCRAGEPCRHHDDAPVTTPAVIYLFTLYRRVRRWGALPDPGGLLQQEEHLMRKLDVIRDVHEEHAEEQQKLERVRGEVQQAMDQLPGMRVIRARGGRG